MNRCLSVAIVTAIVILGALTANADPRADLVAAAVAQVGVTTHYDPSYRSLRYPNGDVPLETGVCADVIIRAFRRIGVDLQQRVHEDMAAHFAAYPKLWKLKRPDTNIDHRRVPNLATFFTRAGAARPVTSRAADYLPGDVVTWRLPLGVPHIGIVVTAGEHPLVVHNIGDGAQREDVLFAWTLTGHYRWIR